MAAIVISMDSHKLENPDLDIRYTLPDRIETWSEGAEIEKCRQVWPEERKETYEL